jgi:hypothetical protein
MIIPDPQDPEGQAIDTETDMLLPGVWTITPDGERHHVGYVLRFTYAEDPEDVGLDIYHPDPDAARWLTVNGTIHIGQIER